MSPNHVIPADNGPLSAIAERVMKCASLTFDVGCDAVVIAVRADLLVDSQALTESIKLREALEQVADPRGTLAEIFSRGRIGGGQDVEDRALDSGNVVDPDHEPQPGGALSAVELWRLRDGNRNSIDESRRLRRLVEGECSSPASAEPSRSPAVAPNHVAILAPHAAGCPATPPQPAPPPPETFVEPPASGPVAKVTILDSGYIEVPAPNTHSHLDARVTVVAGQALEAGSNPPVWVADKPDGVYTDPAGQLDGISGHGTFIAGLVAHIAPQTRLEVVGLRNQEVEIGDLRDPSEQLGLFETEVAVAHAMLRRSDTDVIQCGFAFPTLDDYPSLPFAAVMAELRQPGAPRGGRVAVVAPAGNEQSRRRYWPAALPDVIGVASTNRRGNARAWFSNWGSWCDCCARGEHVYSTFVDWNGPVEGESLSDIEDFDGWARWNGTSFAAPKVAARIAALVAANPGLAPTDAWGMLVTGAGVEPVSDHTLSPHHGVTLPRIPESS